MPRSSLMKPLVVLALPGMYLAYKITEFKRQQQESHRRKVAEKELTHLNHKIDKLLTKLDENDLEPAKSREEECVICINARATMQTFPCGHRVVCRKCFVKTIQMAVSQRMLPLRCVVCRAKILRLKQSGHGKGPPLGTVHCSPCRPNVIENFHTRSAPCSPSMAAVMKGRSRNALDFDEQEVHCVLHKHKRPKVAEREASPVSRRHRKRSRHAVLRQPLVPIPERDEPEISEEPDSPQRGLRSFRKALFPQFRTKSPLKGFRAK